MFKKKSEMEIVMALPDRGINKAKGVSGVLTRMWRQMLADHALTLEQIDNLITSYIYNPRNGVPNNRRDQISARGNLTKEIFKEQMSWKVFCKALRVLGVIKFEISIKAYYYDGKTSIHVSKPVNFINSKTDTSKEL